MITNYLSPLEFQVNVKRLPNVEFFVQRAIIPSITSNPVIQPTPFNSLTQSSDHLQYSPLDISFIIDENMLNYIEIFNWITSVTFPQGFDQFKKLKNSEQGVSSDITITILNSHKNGNIRVNFFGCIPTSLTELTLDTTQSDLIYPEATVTFSYDWFNITTMKD